MNRTTSQVCRCATRVFAFLCAIGVLAVTNCNSGTDASCLFENWDGDQNADGELDGALTYATAGDQPPVTLRPTELAVAQSPGGTRSLHMMFEALDESREEAYLATVSLFDLTPNTVFPTTFRGGFNLTNGPTEFTFLVSRAYTWGFEAYYSAYVLDGKLIAEEFVCENGKVSIGGRIEGSGQEGYNQEWPQPVTITGTFSISGPIGSNGQGADAARLD